MENKIYDLFKDFLAKPWIENSEKKIIDILNKEKENIKNNPDKAKDFLNNFFNKNKSLIQNKCTEKFNQKFKEMIITENKKTKFLLPISKLEDGNYLGKVLGYEFEYEGKTYKLKKQGFKNVFPISARLTILNGEEIFLIPEKNLKEYEQMKINSARLPIETRTSDSDEFLKESEKSVNELLEFLFERKKPKNEIGDLVSFKLNKVKKYNKNVEELEKSSGFVQKVKSNGYELSVDGIGFFVKKEDLLESCKVMKEDEMAFKTDDSIEGDYNDIQDECGIIIEDAISEDLDVYSMSAKELFDWANSSYELKYSESEYINCLRKKLQNKSQLSLFDESEELGELEESHSKVLSHDNLYGHFNPLDKTVRYDVADLDSTVEECIQHDLGQLEINKINCSVCWNTETPYIKIISEINENDTSDMNVPGGFAFLNKRAKEVPENFEFPKKVLEEKFENYILENCVVNEKFLNDNGKLKIKEFLFSKPNFYQKQIFDGFNKKIK